ncbi:MAG: T9SS type A sorting domain-containing protein [Ignavibacteriae bacterium]|nr:T9SS type A sorting domain-containing protein [Ignavibacteriota bacterium]
MIKKITSILFFLTIFSSLILPQTFDGTWSVDYVLPDNEFNPNSIGQRTMSVAVVAENSFVALAANYGNGTYYLVGYKNASQNTGILGTYPYSADSLKMKWIDGFNQVFLETPRDIVSYNNLIYVPSNDVNHNILAFELKADSIYTYPQRYKTGNRELWAIDIDQAGHIFVTVAGDSSTPGSVLVFENPSIAGWNSQGNKATILHEIILPNAGTARGITVNSEGTLIYVSNYLTREIYCYVGNPNDGYSLNSGFNFNANNTFEVGAVTLEVGPWGLQYMNNKNLLFVGHDASFVRSEGYNYGRYYILNPNTGEILDTINVAEWNVKQSGVYNNPDSLGTASGYAATYNLDFDENFNVYTAAYYGWSIEKWTYSGELPTIDITITDIEIDGEFIPEQIQLKQNYPNPFNPTTTIEFQINKQDEVSLKIFSINGELITNLISNSVFSPGNYKLTFDASKLVSGTYFYQLKVGQKIFSNKMVLLK